MSALQRGLSESQLITNGRLSTTLASDWRHLLDAKNRGPAYLLCLCLASRSSGIVAMNAGGICDLNPPPAGGEKALVWNVPSGRLSQRRLACLDPCWRDVPQRRLTAPGKISFARWPVLHSCAWNTPTPAKAQILGLRQRQCITSRTVLSHARYCSKRRELRLPKSKRVRNCLAAVAGNTTTAAGWP